MNRRSRVFETATARAWARHLMQRDDWLVVDVETTGLSATAELVEVAVVSDTGATLLDAVVRPRTPPETGASRVHGLCADVLRDHVRFEQVHEVLAQLLTRRIAISYNAAFDQQVVDHTCHLAGLARIDCTWECAMLRYEQWRGFRASLETACEIESIVDIAPRHRALPDARAVWSLIRRMAGDSS